MSQHLVEKWNALQRTIYVRQLGYVQLFKIDFEAILNVVNLLPNCASVVAYLNDPYTWYQIDVDRDAYERHLVAECRPETGCQPPGWLGW